MHFEYRIMMNGEGHYTIERRRRRLGLWWGAMVRLSK
jgi:hypothetical protein